MRKLWGESQRLGELCFPMSIPNLAPWDNGTNSTTNLTLPYPSAGFLRPSNASTRAMAPKTTTATGTVFQIAPCVNLRRRLCRWACLGLASLDIPREAQQTQVCMGLASPGIQGRIQQIQDPHGSCLQLTI